MINIIIVKPSVTRMYVSQNAGGDATVENGAYVDIAIFTQNYSQNKILKSCTPYAEQPA
jgi:hypothetical protein